LGVTQAILARQKYTQKLKTLLKYLKYLKKESIASYIYPL